MGGAVSSGRDNNELIDNLMGGNYIRSRCVERVFRVLDRADYMTPEARDQAYKDLAWRNGPLHMSAPCIYSEVMEGLELHPGLSFLNVGSGTGYLSTLVGLIIGSSGISHGIEVHPFVVEYATIKLSQFIENSPTLDEFDFCEPKYYSGNGLCLAPLQAPYDRVYCGAGCPEEYQNYFKQLIKVGGILVMPLNDNLVQIRRVSETEWVSRSLLNVSFATLRVPTKEEAAELIRLDEQCPPKLQLLARSVIRSAMRAGLLRRHPELREPPQRAPPAKKSCPRRICIPIEDDSDVEGLNALHDLDRAGGAHEMNALLSLVLSMGQNRVAGALRFDSLDSPVDSSSEEEGGEGEGEGDEPGDDDDDGGSGGSGGSAGGGCLRSAGSPPLEEASPPGAAAPPPVPPRPPAPRPAPRARRGLLTFEFRETLSRARAAAPSTSTVTSAELNDSSATDTKSSEADRASPPSASASRDKHDTRTDSKDGDTKPAAADADADSDSDSESDSSRGPPGVPAEVEIYLGKAARAGGSSSAPCMEWEGAEGGSSDEDAQEDTHTGKQDDKRQKLDSGIGEETTPTSDSSPLKSDSKTDDSDADGSRRSDSLTDDMDDSQQTSRRPKRGRWQSRSGASSSGSSRSGAPRARRHKRRPPPPPPPQGDARRVRLSIVMKRGVKELPLPYALKKFVNLGRCFEF